MAGRSAGQRPPSRRSLGPVTDLESQLPADWWRTLFNATYLQTDGDVVENAANTAADVDLLLAATDLAPDDRVLDLCCGQGRHCLELARRGFRRIVGLDQSRYLLRVARRRARAAGLAVRFRAGDARAPAADGEEFDVVAILGNSFGYFADPAEDRAVLTAVRAALRPGGRVALDLSDGDWVRAHFAPRSWEWIDRSHFACRERCLSRDGTRLICRELVVHVRRGVLVNQFYAERLYPRARLATLLRECGFDLVQEHGSYPSSSARNQDLGMMAHRVFYTARRPRRSGRAPAPVPTGPAAACPVPLFPEVTVLLGDPRLDDPVKRAGCFQPEDLATVARLKAALARLPGYRFRYLDCHATLAADLRRTRPGFVLNLCDEGFGNDSLRELHVPALLELLGIPCSGAGPACLGFCYDKALVSAAAAAMGIPVPREAYLAAHARPGACPVPFPALLKPVCGDGSVGITAASVVRTPGEFAATVARLRAELPGQALLVQEFLAGPEFTVGLVGNPPHDLQALPVLAVDYSRLDPQLPQILGYESKWQLDSPYWADLRYVRAEIDAATRRQLEEHSARLFARLGCRDYARFDFRAGADGTIRLLEVNPNPGWCWDGKLALMAELAGWSYADLLGRILAAAQARCRAPVAAPHPRSLAPPGLAAG